MVKMVSKSVIFWALTCQNRDLGPLLEVKSGEGHSVKSGQKLTRFRLKMARTARKMTKKVVKNDHFLVIFFVIFWSVSQKQRVLTLDLDQKCWYQKRVKNDPFLYPPSTRLWAGGHGQRVPKIDQKWSKMVKNDQK